MKYRKLRIAWSAVCGIVCLLLIVLWVRSYWWRDYAYIRRIGALPKQHTTTHLRSKVA